MTHGHDEQHEAHPQDKRLDALETQVKRVIATLEKYGMQLTEPPAPQPETKK